MRRSSRASCRAGGRRTRSPAHHLREPVVLARPCATTCGSVRSADRAYLCRVMVGRALRVQAYPGDPVLAAWGRSRTCLARRRCRRRSPRRGWGTHRWSRTPPRPPCAGRPPTRLRPAGRRPGRGPNTPPRQRTSLPSPSAQTWRRRPSAGRRRTGSPRSGRPCTRCARRWRVRSRAVLRRWESGAGSWSRERPR